MKKISTYLFSLVLLLGLTFLYGFSGSKNSTKKIRKVQVEFIEGDNNFLTQQMVDKMLIQNDRHVQNQRKSVLDLQGLEQQLLLNPYVEQATVFCTIDGVLKSIVKQRTPIARIHTSSASYYIDNQGVKVPFSNDYSARVMLVTGAINSHELKGIITFVNAVLRDDFLKKEVIGVHKTIQNEFVLSVRSGSHKIELGSLEKLNVKFQKLKAFYKTAFVHKTMAQYKTINLKYHNQVVCSK